MIDYIENGYDENGRLTFERCYTDSDEAMAIADRIEDYNDELAEFTSMLEQCKQMGNEEAAQYFGADSKEDELEFLHAEIKSLQETIESLIEELEAQREADTLAEMPGYGTEWY